MSFVLLLHLPTEPHAASNFFLFTKHVFVWYAVLSVVAQTGNNFTDGRADEMK